MIDIQEVMIVHRNAYLIYGWLLLIIGALYILQDYEVIRWFRFSGWSMLFTILGIGMMIKSCHMAVTKKK